jgi:hypothetical protein
MAVSFLSAWIFSITNVESTKAYSAGSFGLSLGSALCIWGIEEYREKRIRGTRVYVSSSESPILFATLLALKRFVPGIIMVFAGIWYLLSSARLP